MINPTSLWIFFGIVLVLDLLISSVKSAMTHVRLPYLLNLRERDPQNVDRTIKIVERPRLQTGLRLALFLVHLFCAGSIVLLVQTYLQGLTLFLYLFFLFIGMLILGLIEFLLEGLIMKDPEKAALVMWPVAFLLDILFMPISTLMAFILGKNASVTTMATMTDEDLRNWVETGQAEGSLEKGERQMIYSIFRFGDTLAREIMVPRIDVLALDINTTIGEARKALIEMGHSRVPIFEETIDNVVGLLYAKDLLVALNDAVTIASVRHILRIAYFVPEAKKAEELLAEMQARGVHMALVVDEYGGFSGVVTLEDIVEEIVGEIRDEYDQIEEQLYQQIGTGEYIFLGRVDLDDFNEVTGLNIATDNADTLGGFIYGEMGHVPLTGEIVETERVVFKVEEVIGRRILKVRARILSADQTDEDEHHAVERN